MYILGLGQTAQYKLNTKEELFSSHTIKP
jgi:hypothetical protein